MRARIPLVCTYDSDADAAYVYLADETPVADLLPFLDPENGVVNLDVDADGHLFGLEILDARNRLPPALLAAVLEQAPGA